MSKDPPELAAPPFTPRSTFLQTGYLKAVAAVVVATGISWLMFPFFELANLIMTYLLAIVVIAARYVWRVDHS